MLLVAARRAASAWHRTLAWCRASDTLGGALVWAGAYIGVGWLFRRQLEDVAAAVSGFGAWFGGALGAGLLVYLISKFVRRRRLYRVHRMRRITPGDLKRWMETGEPLVVVDLRPEVERQEGSVPGALVVAFEDLDSLLPAIAKKEVVFYCSCPDELSSVRAALRLKRHGITHLHALLGGFSAWRELGFPVEAPLSGVARA